MTLTPLITQEEIAQRIPTLAEEITTILGPQQQVIALAILKGGLWFAADLLRFLPLEYHLESLRLSSYGTSTTSSGSLTFIDTPAHYKDKVILIIDDILDSGLTLHTLKQKLLKQGAKSVYTCVAVTKNAPRELFIEADFSGFFLENKFLVGYGMDYAEKFRNLPYIAHLDLKN